MIWKDLQPEILRLESEGLSHREIARKLKCDRDVVRKAVDRKDWKVEPKEAPAKKKEPPASDKPLVGGVIHAPDVRRKKLAGRRFVITSAQNNTNVHYGFLNALHQFCQHRNAELVVSTFTYNKSGFQNGQKDDDDLYYDPAIVPFVLDESCEVAKGLVFCGELNILPTAVDPLSGFDSYNGESSCIVPHTKMALKSIATMKGRDAKFLFTTGAVTQRNYIQKKAGQKADFHHVFGALYVEVDEDGQWFCRQLVANEAGVFCDLHEKFTPDGVSEVRVEAVNWGDVHAGKMSEGCEGVMLDILETLRPKYQFIHDVLDFEARNHHSIKDKFHWAKMLMGGRGSVLEEIREVGRFLRLIEREWCQTVVVESNHDLALTRWLREANTDFDPINGEFYHLANARIYQAIREGDNHFQPMRWALETYGPALSNTTFLMEDESFVLHDIEFGMHGHLGPNGARGNPNNLKKIGVKANTGHTHSATICDGVYVAGVSADLDMGYNKGPSSWSHSHIVTYETGKRAIITARGDKWRDMGMAIEKTPPKQKKFKRRGAKQPEVEL